MYQIVFGTHSAFGRYGSSAVVIRFVLPDETVCVFATPIKRSKKKSVMVCFILLLFWHYIVGR